MSVGIGGHARAVAALQWWNAVRLASLHPLGVTTTSTPLATTTTKQLLLQACSLHPWLARSSNAGLMRRAALNPYPILHRGVKN